MRLTRQDQSGVLKWAIYAGIAFVAYQFVTGQLSSFLDSFTKPGGVVGKGGVVDRTVNPKADPTKIEAATNYLLTQGYSSSQLTKISNSASFIADALGTHVKYRIGEVDSLDPYGWDEDEEGAYKELEKYNNFQVKALSYYYANAFTFGRSLYDDLNEFAGSDFDRHKPLFN
jgi:hypothetical protein